MSEQWSEWIDHKPGDPCPIPWAMPMEWEYQHGGDKKFIATGAIDLYETGWGGSQPNFKITRYRYRLDRAPAGFVPPGAEKPWVPEQQPGFGPWIEADGYPKGIAGKYVLVLLPGERKDKRLYSTTYYVCDDEYDWCDDWPAYCVKLEDQPTQEQVEATQKPETPEADASEDAKAANRPMFGADDVGVLTGTWTRYEARQAWQKPTAAPGFMVRDVRSSAGLLTVREADHRLGLWE